MKTDTPKLRDMRQIAGDSDVYPLVCTYLKNFSDRWDYHLEMQAMIENLQTKEYTMFCEGYNLCENHVPILSADDLLNHLQSLHEFIKDHGMMDNGCEWTIERASHYMVQHGIDASEYHCEFSRWLTEDQYMDFVSTHRIDVVELERGEIITPTADTTHPELSREFFIKDHSGRGFTNTLDFIGAVKYIAEAQETEVGNQINWLLDSEIGDELELDEEATTFERIK